MAWFPVAAIAVGAAMKAYGEIQQGSAASANAKAQANAATYNAVVNEQNAQQAGMLASSRELAQRANAAQQLGNIRAGLAESGGGFEGTNAGVLNQSEVNAELDALTTRHQGVLQARDYTAQAGLNYYQAKVARVNASAAKRAGYWGAAAGLIGASGGIYGYGATQGWWGGSSGGSGYT